MKVGIIGCGNISETYFNCQKIFNNGYRNSSQMYEDKILCLPNHVKIKKKNIKFVATLIEKFYKKI